MMKNQLPMNWSIRFKFILLALAFAVMVTPANSQDFWNLLDNEPVKFTEVQEAAEAYFSVNPKGKASGYKLYKRWEYWAQRNLDAQGFIISIESENQEMAKFRRNTKGLAARAGEFEGDWKELGPFSWTRTSSWSPGLGRIVAIAVEPTIQNLIFAGSPGGGIWRSTDAGASWTPLGDQFDNMFIWSIAIDPNNSDIVYLGNSLGQLFKSTNQGDSWTQAGSVGSTCRRILINPNNSNIILAGSNSGIYRSTDAGATFTRSQFQRAEDLEFKPGNTNIVYAAGSGFYKSTDNGVTFTQITSGFTTSERMKLAVTPANDNVVYVIQKQGSGFGRVYRSTDEANNFTIQNDIDVDGFNYLGSQAGRDMAIMVSNTDANEIHIGGLNHYRSLDGGVTYTGLATWSQPNDPSYVHADIEVMQYINGTLYVGSDGGIFRSTNQGDNYTDLTQNGLNVHQFYRIGGSKTDANVVTGGSQDNGTIMMKGTDRSFISWLGADGMETFVDYTDADVAYGSSQYGNFYKTTNGGASYSGLSEPESSGNWVTPFEIDPFDHNTIYSGFNNIYRHRSGGTTFSGWESISDNLTGVLGNMDEIAIAGSNNNYIYIADGSSVFVTKNGQSDSPTWESIKPTSSPWINYIHVDPNDEEHVLICGSFSIYESSDAGQNWSEISGTLPNITVETVVFDNADNNGIYAGLNNSGIYYKNDNLTDWIPFKTNLPNVRVTELEIDYLTDHIRAATYGRGLWESALNTAQPIALTAPTGLTVSNVSATSQIVSWSNQSIGESGHRVEISLDGVTFTEIGGTGKDTLTSHELAAGTEYFYRVRSFDVLNRFSGYSAVVSMTTESDLNVCQHVADYDNAILYDVVGSMVVYNDNVYKSTAVVQGNNPENNGSPWTLLSACDANGVTVIASSGSNGNILPEGNIVLPINGNFTFDISANAGFQISDVLVDGVSQGSISSFTFTNLNGNHTISATFTQANDDCNHPLWVSSTVYDVAGNEVIHLGKRYRNLWWTQNQEPGTGQNSPWELLGFCGAQGLDCSQYPDYNAQTIYSQPGNFVVFNSDVYKNLWWVQNQNPSTSSAWELQGPCDASTISEPIINAKVANSSDFAIHLLVWPNPSTSDINVDFDAPVRNASIELINASGDVVDSKVLFNGTMKTGMNVSELPNGIYHLRAIGDRLLETTTIVINK